MALKNFLEKPRGAKKPSLATQLTLYRYRFFVGYILFAAVLLALVVYRFWALPNGMSSGEVATATESAKLSLASLLGGTASVVDLPYHVMQKLSIMIFGPGTFAFRLPSVILAVGAGVVLERLLKRLFRENIAVIASIIGVSSVLFLTLARTGTPAMMSIFLTVALIYLAVRIFQKDKAEPLWVGLFFAFAAASVYSPLLFLFVIFGAVVMFHPKSRARLKSMSKAFLVTMFAIFILLLLPFVFGLFFDLGDTARGLFAAGGWHFITTNLPLLGTMLVGVGGETTVFAPPAISLAAWALGIWGVVCCFRERFAARSIMMLVWFGLALVILLFNPSLIYLVFVPLILLMTAGVEALLHSWNALFPVNPYARIFGLVPIVVLMVGLIFLSGQRYFLANFYEKNIVTVYSSTPVDVIDYEKMNPGTMIVADADEVVFYHAIFRDTPVATAPTDDARKFIATPSARFDKRGLDVVKITTSELRDNNVTTAVYEK
jgi:hypothetical protein